MKRMLPVLALIAGLSTSGCANTAVESRLLDCPGWVRPIYTADEDVLTDETAREIVTHNDLYDQFCPSAD